MKILSIETSCDETGISVLEYSENSKQIEILGNALASQIDIHAQYGGVFPALAKRAHAEKIIPLTIEALNQSGLLIEKASALSEEELAKISFLDAKEKDLKIHLVEFLVKYQKPDIDYIAVTVGPGLEPALWVGVNTARALGNIWNIPVISVDHMEGHLLAETIEPVESSSTNKVYKMRNIQFPALALLISGGHTELVLAENWGQYKKIGQTRDDAVGEAFDKVARMLGLAYPGGPAISKLAEEWRGRGKENIFSLPRPMMHSDDYDFSFSGIKTAVLYAIRDLGRDLNDEEKMMMACEFENAVTEVLLKKTFNAVQEYNIQTIIVGGGVAGNTYIKSEFQKTLEDQPLGIKILFPESALATDNAVMIAIAGLTKALSGFQPDTNLVLKANGNLSL